MAAGKTVIGLDVGSYMVKAVALSGGRDRVTLQGYAQARIENQDVGEVIRKVVDQLAIKSRRVVTSVSGRSVIVRQVETPRLGPDELKAHIAYEADKYIPFGTEEVIIDAQPLPEPGGAKTANMQVMLVAVRKGFVQDHINQLKSAGVTPEVIDVDVFALANCYELLGPPAAPDSEKKATALIDIGASKSNIAIVQGTRVLFTREVYLAGNEISDAIARTFNEPIEDIERIKLAPGETLEALIDAAMPAFEDLANEIRLSFDYVEGQFDMEVATVVLTGGSSQLANIGEILGNILSRQVVVFDPLAGLELVPSKYDIPGLDANSPSLTVALGLAAHLLNHGSSSLGTAQSHAWQPRQKEGAAAAPARPAGSDAAGATRIPTGTSFNPPSQMTLNPPSQMTLNPPTSMPMMDSAPTVPPMPTPLPEQTHPGGSTSRIIADKNKSGLLVVLDDDQEIPTSEKFEKRSATSTQTKTGSKFKVESFDDDDDKQTRAPVDLPELPKL
jgi:type IV pilus assembly protein PilM